MDLIPILRIVALVIEVIVRVLTSPIAAAQKLSDAAVSLLTRFKDNGQV